jgi:two-component system chemotaxis sensor kinase CheA
VPSATVRVSTDTLDRFLAAVGEVILSSSQLRRAAGDLEMSAAVAAGFDRMEHRIGELQRRVMELRTTPLMRVMETIPRTARGVAERLGKRVEVQLVGAELELDRSILDRLNEPMLHLVRNAVDHGIEDPAERVRRGKPEVGHIVVEARREKDSIAIAVRDDGRGIDIESVRAKAIASGLLLADLAEDLPPDDVASLVFHPGLSTALTVSEISGRGVGMDAVKAVIESLGGTVAVTTDAGAGTTTTLRLPVTAAVQRVLLVGVGDEIVALPIAKIERIVEVEAGQIEGAGGEAFTMLDEDLLLVLDLGRQIAVPSGREVAAEEASAPGDDTAMVPLVVTEVRGERIALRVDRLAGQREIYVKPVSEMLAGVRVLAGLTMLDDGRPVFLLDLNHLA